MSTKLRRILGNAAGTFSAWVLAGVTAWLLLRYFDPAAELSPTAQQEVINNLRSFASTVAQIAATMAGFILASLALLLSLSDRALLERMGKSGHLHVLILRMKLSMVLCLVLTVFSIALIVLPGLGIRHLYGVLGICVMVAVSIGDVLWKLMMVFMYLSPLQRDESNVRTLYAEELTDSL